MVFLPRHHEYKKKKSKAPYAFIVIFIVILGAIYSQERKIRIFLAGDLSQKIGKQKEKIQIALEQNELTDILTRDFHTYTNDYLEKEPLKPSASYFKSLAYYYELMLSGARFDSFSLVKRLNDPVDLMFGDNEKAKEDSNQMFIHARRAAMFQKGFDQEESNRFLLFLGESIRNKKNPTALYGDYKDIKPEKLDAELTHPFTWLMFYNAIRNGNLADLEKLLEMNANENYSGKLLLTEREINFIKGETYYYGKDYVLALNHIRKVKTTESDQITVQATLTEARIFYKQNLPKKGVDLLLEEYKAGRDKNKLYLNQLREWSGMRPDLNIDIPTEKKEEVIDEDEI
jgi:hypothetical protein